MRFIDYDVEPVKDDGEFCEVCQPEDADFWSLYGRDQDGFAHCIGDFNTKEYAELIRDAIQWHPPAG